MTEENTTLSNTATPKYYAEFKRLVLSGVIPICTTISQEMNRIDNLISSPEYYFDQRPVDAFIRFCESEMTKTDGGQLVLLDTFKLWSEQIFGWFYYVEELSYDKTEKRFIKERKLKRLIKKQYLILPRGAAKTMYLSLIQAYFLIIDGETTQQIAVAFTMRQADETLSTIRTSLRIARGPLFKFLTMPMKNIAPGNKNTLIDSTKVGIEMFLTGSSLEIRPMSIQKLQSLRTKVATVDEWLATAVREDVVGAIEQGASKLDDYIIVCASSEGTFRNGVGDEIKHELMLILNGDYLDPHMSIFYYKLDTIEEVGQPEMWVKAQPNIGQTVTYEVYHRDVLRAQQNPSARNDILAKRFNLPMEGYTFFFTYEETIPHSVKHTFTKMSCSLGVDLSQGDDFCSFLFLFPLRGNAFGIRTLNFITSNTYQKLGHNALDQYNRFIKEGSLIVLDGVVLDIPTVFYHLEEFIVRNEYDVVTMGYDPYNADMFVKLWTESFGPFAQEVVRQGSKTESVPLGELKQLAEKRLLFFFERIMSFAMGNAMVLTDSNGNRKLYKYRYENKIDPVSALVDAYVAYQRRRELFE